MRPHGADARCDARTRAQIAERLLLSPPSRRPLGARIGLALLRLGASLEVFRLGWMVGNVKQAGDCVERMAQLRTALGGEVRRPEVAWVLAAGLLPALLPGLLHAGPAPLEVVWSRDD